MEMTIRSVSNGFFVRQDGIEAIYATLDELFANMLLIIEGRSYLFSGVSYGDVKIFRKPGIKYESHKEK